MAPKLRPRQPTKSYTANNNVQRVKKRNMKRKAGTAGRPRPRMHCLSKSSSVQLVAVVPCCSDEKELRKYSRLGLDSALFCSKRRPARRKQSHISVITISSSDEETSNIRVVEWLESMELDKQSGHLCDEVSIGDMDPCGSESRTAQVCEADGIRHQMSLLHLPSSSPQLMGLLSVETPEKQTELPSETLTSVTHVEGRTLLDTHDQIPLPSIRSFFTNPPSNVNMTRKGPHSVWSRISSAVLNLEDNSGQSPQFFFGLPTDLEQEPITSTSVFLNSEINNFPSTSSEYSNTKL